MQCKLTFRSAGETHIGPQDIDLLELGHLITASAKFLRPKKGDGQLTLLSLTDQCIELAANVSGSAADHALQLHRELRLPRSERRRETNACVDNLAKAAAKSSLEVSFEPEGCEPVSLSANSVLNSSYITAINFIATYCGHKLKDDGSTVLHLRIDGENYDAALNVSNELIRREMLQRLPNDVRSRVNCEGTVLRDWRSLKVLQYSIRHIAPAKDTRTALVDLISAMRPWVAAEFVDEELSQSEGDEDSV